MRRVGVERVHQDGTNDATHVGIGAPALSDRLGCFAILDATMRSAMRRRDEIADEARLRALQVLYLS